VIKRYRRLWTALKEPQKLDPNDRHAVERAMRALHDLGFTVEEVSVSLDGENKTLIFQPKLVAAGYHQARLLELTGLETQELQAKRLLASFDRYRSRMDEPRPPINQSALKWLNEVFRPTLAHVPQGLVGRVEPAQMFHEILEHRWNLSEKAGGDVGLDNATRSYISEILPFRSDSGRIIA
jgi:hypothetical protein